MANPSAWPLRMGHLDIALFAFAPDLEEDIRFLLQSLSLGLNPPFQHANHDKVYLVFLTPETPEWYVASLDLPAWGKPICKSLYHIVRTISTEAQDDLPGLSDLLTTVDLAPTDWYSADLKTFFYNRGNLCICFAFIYREEQPQKILLHRISGHIYYLATYWYAMHNGLLLHSAAVTNQKGGFLFLGEGGAGKSTVARLGSSIGASVLSDDLSFVANKGMGKYELAAAPGPASRYTTSPHLRPGLRGVFRVVQDTQDGLAPLSPLATAHVLFRSFEWSHWIDHLPPDALSKAFYTACDIARSVPGYELRFRKSPDFWKLIEEQFDD